MATLNKGDNDSHNNNNNNNNKQAVTVEHPVSGCAFLPVVVSVGIGSQTVGSLPAADATVQCVQCPRLLQYHVAHAIEVSLFFKILSENIRVFVPFWQYRNSVTVDTGMFRVSC